MFYAFTQVTTVELCCGVFLYIQDVFVACRVLMLFESSIYIGYIMYVCWILFMTNFITILG